MKLIFERSVSGRGMQYLPESDVEEVALPASLVRTEAPNGCVDIEALKAVLGEDTAGLMLTNPNTVGIFDENILEITRLVHEAGGQCYYDGANLNAVMGVVRPGDMGFDCIHSNLNKTFATPHGGGGTEIFRQCLL